MAKVATFAVLLPTTAYILRFGAPARSQDARSRCAGGARPDLALLVVHGADGLVAQAVPPTDAAWDDEPERVALAYLRRVAASFEASPEKRERIVPLYRPLYDWLEATVRATAEQAAAENVPAEAFFSAEEELQALKDESLVVHRIGYRLEEILLGTTDPLSLLFKDDTVYRVYEKGPTFYQANQILGQALDLDCRAAGGARAARGGQEGVGRSGVTACWRWARWTGDLLIANAPRWEHLISQMADPPLESTRTWRLAAAASCCATVATWQRVHVVVRHLREQQRQHVDHRGGTGNVIKGSKMHHNTWAPPRLRSVGRAQLRLLLLLLLLPLSAFLAITLESMTAPRSPSRATSSWPAASTGTAAAALAVAAAATSGGAGNLILQAWGRGQEDHPLAGPALRMDGTVVVAGGWWCWWLVAGGAGGGGGWW